MPGSLHLDGKLGTLWRLNAIAAGQLIHMPDQTSNRRILVMIWLVKSYKSMAETFSSAHNAGAASAGAASAGAASTGAARAGPTCSRMAEQGASPFPPAAVLMVPPPSLQHAAEWQSRVQVPPHLQRCADGATTFSPTQHLLSGDVTPPEDQRSPSADQGLPQRTSGTTCDPVGANPNPAVARASAPPVSGPELGGGVRFRYRRSFPLPTSGGGASLLTSTHWPWPSVSCRGRFSRPPSQDAGRSYSPACNFMKMQSGGGGAPVEDRIIVYLNIIFVICVSLLWRQ
jgi:hypothetical protein